MDLHDKEKQRPFPLPLQPSLIAGWITMLLNAIARMVAGFGGHDENMDPEALPPTSPGALQSFTAQRRLMGYVNTGIYKVERIRRQSRIAKQYQGALRTVRLTRRAIRRTPRSSRYLFKGYYTLLKDARVRIKHLYAQINHLQQNLSGYDPFALEDEIARLETIAKRTADLSSRSDADALLASRKELLETVRAFDEQLNVLASQLGAISAKLELNHVKVISIAGRTTLSSGNDLFADKMHEVTEQLTLLEESLRELGR